MKSKSNKNNQVATKEDIKKLVTKGELKKVERVLRQEIIKVEGRLEGVEEGQKGLDVKLDRIQNTLDGFVGAVDDLRKENSAGNLRLRDHEKRITKLESPQAA